MYLTGYAHHGCYATKRLCLYIGYSLHIYVLYPEPVKGYLIIPILAIAHASLAGRSTDGYALLV